jgi:hypothetical protein
MNQNDNLAALQAENHRLREEVECLFQELKNIAPRLALKLLVEHSSKTPSALTSAPQAVSETPLPSVVMALESLLKAVNARWIQLETAKDAAQLALDRENIERPDHLRDPAKMVSQGVKDALGAICDGIQQDSRYVNYIVSAEKINAGRAALASEPQSVQNMHEVNTEPVTDTTGNTARAALAAMKGEP